MPYDVVFYPTPVTQDPKNTNSLGHVQLWQSNSPALPSLVLPTDWLFKWLADKLFQDPISLPRMPEELVVRTQPQLVCCCCCCC